MPATKKTSKFPITGPFIGKSTRGFASEKASNAENIPMQRPVHITMTLSLLQVRYLSAIQITNLRSLLVSWKITQAKGAISIATGMLPWTDKARIRIPIQRSSSKLNPNKIYHDMAVRRRTPRKIYRNGLLASPTPSHIFVMRYVYCLYDLCVTDYGKICYHRKISMIVADGLVQIRHQDTGHLQQSWWHRAVGASQGWFTCLRWNLRIRLLFLCPHSKLSQREHLPTHCVKKGHIHSNCHHVWTNFNRKIVIW